MWRRRQRIVRLHHQVYLVRSLRHLLAVVLDRPQDHRRLLSRHCGHLISRAYSRRVWRICKPHLTLYELVMLVEGMRNVLGSLLGSSFRLLLGNAGFWWRLLALERLYLELHIYLEEVVYTSHIECSARTMAFPDKQVLIYGHRYERYILENKFWARKKSQKRVCWMV